MPLPLSYPYQNDNHLILDEGDVQLCALLSMTAAMSLARYSLQPKPKPYPVLGPIDHFAWSSAVGV